MAPLDGVTTAGLPVTVTACSHSKPTVRPPTGAARPQFLRLGKLLA